jgi:hypothetical protein
MKKLISWVGVIVLAIVLFHACAPKRDQKQQDVQRLADLACEMRIIALNLTENDYEGLQRFTETMTEFSELSQEMTQKYNITDEDEEFEQMLRDALLNTHCSDVDLDDLFDFF